VSADWPEVPLRDVLKRSEDWIQLDPLSDYRELTVKLWGKGVVLRRITKGADIAADKRLRVRVNQFVLSRIDARNGALGLVPSELDGAVVSNDFPAFTTDEKKILPEYIGWLSKSKRFVDLCQKASEGTTNRVRLQEDRFLSMPIPLPPLDEQRRISTKLAEADRMLGQVFRTAEESASQVARMLAAAFKESIKGAHWRPMQEVAPVVRRPVAVYPNSDYPEVGIRSFGRGTFHKQAISGLEVAGKRLFAIKPGDLVFMNVFAWEGAVAVAKAVDAGRYGSHRFISCVPSAEMATSEFLCFFFLTPEGLEELGRASPGGAGRNRTLGLEALSRIEVPVPSLGVQHWFCAIKDKAYEATREREEITRSIGSLAYAFMANTLQG